MLWILMLHLTVSCGRLFTGAEETPAGIEAIGAQVEQVGESGGILAIETKRPGEPLFGRQMTNGQDLLKLIYVNNGRQLAACERFQGQTPELSLFLRQFSNLTSFQQQGQGGGGGGAKFKDADFKWPPINWHRSWDDCIRLQETQRQQRSSSSSSIHRLSSSGHSPRSRRSMILPGTTWCGMGNRSEAGNLIDGVHVETDRCCRQHDLCPHTIEGFTRKYNYYNFRFHTISYCECDSRFRRCLLMAGDDNSNLVGNLFFNVLGMKCFTLQLDEVCAERTWYGRCTRTRREPTAYIRDATPYNNYS